MDQVSKYIFLFLIATTVLNLIIAVAARVKSDFREYNLLICYWAAVFGNFIAVAILSKSSTQVAFAYYFQFISMLFMSKMLMNSRGMKQDLKLYVPAYLVGASVSTYLLLFTDAGFTLSLLPITTATALPLVAPLWNSLISHRHQSNWIEKSMGIMFVTAIVNHFNYAFFRLDPEAAWWGWSVSIAQFQCLSIFLPMLINHNRAIKERSNVELAIGKLTGNSNRYDVEIDELYRTLELQIGQKEELTKRLQSANEYLEEEREMNEVLIKTISHDLANPLTVINAYVDMINKGKIPEEDHKMIWERIRNNTLSALSMIARIREAIVTRNISDFVAVHDVSVDRAIKTLLGQFESRLKEKEIKVNYDNQVKLNSFVSAEENTLVEHVFANIMSNAIKFSHPNSKIDILVKKYNQTVEITFRDYGAGIDESRLSKRLLGSTPGTQGEPGSGFGVMVMGYFLRKFEGTYDIHSDGKGFGTVVTIRLKKSIDRTIDLNPSRETANFLSSP